MKKWPLRNRKDRKQNKQQLIAALGCCQIFAGRSLADDVYHTKCNYYYHYYSKGCTMGTAELLIIIAYYRQID